MTRGDVVADMASVNYEATLTIRPAVGIEWVIHNIYHEAEVTLSMSDNVNVLYIALATGRGSWSAYFFHLTNTHFLKVQNQNAGGAKLISYDGIVTKE